LADGEQRPEHEEVDGEEGTTEDAEGEAGGQESKVSPRLLRLLTRFHVALYRASRGRLGGRVRKTALVLLLTATGRKSGKQRTIPLLYLEDGGRYVVIASLGGAPKHPVWYLNLLANPAATIRVGDRVLAVTAKTAVPEERDRLWLLAVQMYPPYNDYRARTDREIPVVILTPDALLP
jgi:deazaflavin-dependent oxidoreductase (nitroreductase family)